MSSETINPVFWIQIEGEMEKEGRSRIFFKSALIVAWKCNFPTLLEIMTADQPTDM